MKSVGLLIAFGLAAVLGAEAAAQRGSEPPKPPAAPRASAPLDITGNWVSIVTEDWRYRMVVPKKGDYASVPLNPEGKRVADAWDPAKIAADGCKPFGAAALMRVPGRLKISWENDSTLKIETDAGQQTRLLHFGLSTDSGSSRAQSRDGKPSRPQTVRTWQGYSAAEWERVSQSGAAAAAQEAPPQAGTLKVVTTSLRAGYLRKNGVPYSEDAVVTEYFDRLTSSGADWLTVMTVVDDPRYLTTPFVTSTHFKREPDASKWMPVPCESSGAKR